MALHCLQQVLKEYLSSHIVDTRNLEELIRKVVAYFTQETILFNMGTTYTRFVIYKSVYFSPQKYSHFICIYFLFCTKLFMIINIPSLWIASIVDC